MLRADKFLKHRNFKKQHDEERENVKKVDNVNTEKVKEMYSDVRKRLKDKTMKNPKNAGRYNAKKANTC